MSAHRELLCADLFAGAGGFSLGAKLAGFNLRLAVENDHHAVETYRLNLVAPGASFPKVYDGDIRKLDPKKVARAVFAKGEGCDLLLGGPPCQGFSTHRIKDAGVADDRNNLIHTYFEFVRALEPTAFLMENVPGMLWPRHKPYLDEFFDEGARSGYHIFAPVVIDARNFGVPQRRKRVFILGMKDKVDRAGLQWPPKPTHGSPADRLTQPELLAWLSCKSAFRGAPRNDENDAHMKSGATLVDAFKKTPKNGGSRHSSGRVLPCHEGHDGHNDVYGRIDPRGPAPTMTTACINPSKGRFVHPVQHHGITVRQAARIQTFPDSFEFVGGLMAAGKQVGNAVPVELARVLVAHLKALLLNAAHERALDASIKEPEFA